VNLLFPPFDHAEKATDRNQWLSINSNLPCNQACVGNLRTHSATSWCAAFTFPPRTARPSRTVACGQSFAMSASVGASLHQPFSDAMSMENLYFTSDLTRRS
jgi:hypothetical protein